MELSQTDFDILNAIKTGRVGGGTLINHFVDYCDNAIGGTKSISQSQQRVSFSRIHRHPLTNPRPKAAPQIKDRFIT
ncbi:hypothetical protein [Lentilactobacillus parafarraginis]|nr:hypothetical protein [Lentilactobacillus parafarraginis]